jgi:ribosomal protein L11 methyltransferase
MPAARALDMGCGSGVLAMAIARLWGARVLAVDNDPLSVETATDNAAKNSVAHLVTAVLGEGYGGPDVSGHGPYDLIAANILADPLIAMAPRLAGELAPGGHAVLSGILAKQASRVQAAHVAQGLSVRRRYVFGDWATLVMRKR